MNLSLDPEMQKLIDERVRSGQYTSAEEVVTAALVALNQQEDFGDFNEGELDSLLNAAEQSLVEGGSLDGDQAYKNRRAQRSKDQQNQ